MVFQGKWLRVRDLEEYFFCPRMFYYIHVLGIEREPGLWSSIGKEVQEEVSGFIHESFRVVGEEVFLESMELGVRGRIDYLVETSTGLAPLEVKYSKRIRPWWKYVLVLYALLVEDQYGKPVKQAYMVTSSKKTFIVNIEDHDRRYVLESINRARKILDGETIPRPHYSKTCINCDYKKHCFP